MYCQVKTVSAFGLLVLLVFIFGIVNSDAVERKHIVMIDPAHGGEDHGVNSNDKLLEKNITLAVALVLQKELTKENKLEVILTRNTDKTISNEERKKNILKIKPDVILSLHINSGFGRSAAGFEVYYPGLNKKTEDNKVTHTGVGSVNARHLNDSIRLAQLVQKNLDSLFPRKGRGLREADVPLMEGLTIPALIVELGFNSNPEEKKKMISEKTQVEVAKALSNSIKAFFR